MHSLTHCQVTRSQQRLLKSGLDSQIATLEQCGHSLRHGCSAQDKPCRRSQAALWQADASQCPPALMRKGCNACLNGAV
jgi:hypothetical protein